MAVTYRPAADHDIQAVSDVYWASLLDTYQRHGFDAHRTALPVNPFYAFALREEPQGFFVAEDRGKVVGATISWVRQSLWFLSHLFILPEFQAKGIGASLLDRTMNYCAASTCTQRAVITMAFNPVSVSLYLKNGMYPAHDLYLMTLDTGEKGQPQARPRDSFQETIHLLGRQQEELTVIDTEVLGASREKHHRFFLAEGLAQGFLVRYKDRPVAYVYLWPDGRIGPMAALKDAPYRDLLKTIVRYARQLSPTLTMMIPGSNRTAIEVALSQGFTLSIPYVLLSSEGFGALDRYICHSPGLM